MHCAVFGDTSAMVQLPPVNTDSLIIAHVGHQRTCQLKHMQDDDNEEEGDVRSKGGGAFKAPEISFVKGAGGHSRSTTAKARVTMLICSWVKPLISSGTSRTRTS